MMRKFSESPTWPMRALQIWQVLIGAAYHRQLLTYGMLAKMLGHQGARTLTQPLGHIMFYCRENGLPPLTILVVNQDTGCPGEGFTGAEANADREAVFQFNWYDIVPPTPE